MISSTLQSISARKSIDRGRESHPEASACFQPMPVNPNWSIYRSKAPGKPPNGWKAAAHHRLPSFSGKFAVSFGAGGRNLPTFPMRYHWESHHPACPCGANNASSRREKCVLSNRCSHAIEIKQAIIFQNRAYKIGNGTQAHSPYAQQNALRLPPDHRAGTSFRFHCRRSPSAVCAIPRNKPLLTDCLFSV